MTVRAILEGATAAQPVWETDPSSSGVRASVGTDPRCTWAVQGSGVEPHHLELYWDGAVLWVAPIGQGPQVVLDGQPVQDWKAAQDGSVVSFGSARLRIGLGDGDAAGDGDFELADLGPDDGFAPLQGEATMVAPGLSDADEPAPIGLRGMSAPALGAAGAAAARIANFEARQSATSEPAPLQGQATQMVDFSALPEAGAAPAVAAPRLGQKGGAASSVPTAETANPDVGDGKFAAPPSFDAAAATGKHKTLQEQIAAVPTRTLILSGVMVLALIGVSVMLVLEEPPPTAALPALPPTEPTPEPVRDPGQVALDAAPAEVSPEELAQLPRKAAEALSANDTTEALRCYAILARHQPGNSSYRVFVEILAKETQRACRNGVDPQGRPCE